MQCLTCVFLLVPEHRRYLRAREWSVEAATKMYLDAQKWRKEVDLAGMMEEAGEGKDIFAERKQVAEDGWKMCECGGAYRGWSGRKYSVA
jgi:hypothetical protein